MKRAEEKLWALRAVKPVNLFYVTPYPEKYAPSNVLGKAFLGQKQQRHQLFHCRYLNQFNLHVVGNLPSVLQ